MEQEPAHLAPPAVLLVSGLFDGRFQAPVLGFVIHGRLRRRGWVRPLGLFYSGAAVTSTTFHFATTSLGPTPPPNPRVYRPFKLPWLIAPALLGLRLLRDAPFAAACVRSGGAKAGRLTSAEGHRSTARGVRLEAHGAWYPPSGGGSAHPPGGSARPAASIVQGSC